ncbi:MAG: hypothetical protein ACUVX8_02885 [Candidatus Zipacnadales bacterium]
MKEHKPKSGWQLLAVDVSYFWSWYTFRRRQDKRDLTLRRLNLPDPAGLSPEIREKLERLAEKADKTNQILEGLFTPHRQLCVLFNGLCCLWSEKRWKLTDLYLFRLPSITREQTGSGKTWGVLLGTVCSAVIARLIRKRPKRLPRAYGTPNTSSLSHGVTLPHCDHLVPGKGCELPSNRCPTCCRLWLCRPLRRALGREGIVVWRSCLEELECCERAVVEILKGAYKRQ